MKILLVFTYGMSLKLWQKSGMYDREVSLYKKLQHEGHQVTFLTYGDGSDREFSSDLGSIQILPIYETLKKPSFRPLRLLQTLWIPFKFKNELRQTDIIKTNQILGAWVAVLLKWKLNCPLITRLGFEPNLFAIKGQCSWSRKWVMKSISSLAYKQADRVHVSSVDDATFIQEKFRIPAEKIFVKGNYIDTELFKPLPGVPEKELVYVGRLSAQKNLVNLCRAAGLAKTHLDIYGDGDQEDELKALVEKEALPVHFKGRVANDQLPEVLSRYKAFILCSHFEGNPKTLLEAMSCEKAVIGSDVTGIGNIIQHQKNGFLSQCDPNNIARTINDVMKNEILRKKTGANARQYILEHHSLKNYLEFEKNALTQLHGTKHACA